MKRLTLWVMVGSVSVLVAIGFSAYQFGQQSSYDECLPTMRAMNAKLIEYAVADSLRECFEARPTVQQMSLALGGIWFERQDSVIAMHVPLNTQKIMDAIAKEKTWNKYTAPKDTLLDSLIDTTIFFADSFPCERYKGFRNVRLTNDLMMYREWTKKSTLYTDSGLNWSALPFLMLEDSNHIFITAGDNTGDTLRVLEWVQRPVKDSVEVEDDIDCDTCSVRPDIYLFHYEYRWRWSARVEELK